MKTITYIDTSEEWEITNDWDSHRPLLHLALQKNNGFVIEAGCGFGSTVLIDKFVDKGNLISYETNEMWFEKMYPLIKGAMVLLKKWDDIYLQSCNLFFCDAAPAEDRILLMDKFKDLAEVIIVHDTEESADYVYHLKDILNTFKYRLDFRPEGMPHTTAVSNFIDVEKWVE
jgi:hypothetical protein